MGRACTLRTEATGHRNAFSPFPRGFSIQFFRRDTEGHDRESCCRASGQLHYQGLLSRDGHSRADTQGPYSVESDKTKPRAVCIRCSGASRTRQAGTQAAGLASQGGEALFRTAEQGCCGHSRADTQGPYSVETVETKPRVTYIRYSGASRTRPAGTQGLTSDDKTNSQRPSSQDEQSRADDIFTSIYRLAGRRSAHLHFS